MEATDIINFFLHDKIAAKTWKRTLDHVNEDIHSYVYSSVKNPDYNFKLVHCWERDQCWIDYYGDGRFTTIHKQDITGLKSYGRALMISIGEYSYLDVLCGNEEENK